MTDLAIAENHPTIKGAVVLSLNRPDARNALSIDLLTAAIAQVDAIADDPTVRAVILTGAGRAFCAGMDLRQVLDDPAAPARLLGLLADLTLRIRATPAPVVARVNGAAIGGGCGLACVCDFALTHADSKMGFPEVDLGVCPAVVAPWLVKRVGPGRARQILLAGGLMSGQRAFELGIVSSVTPTQEALDAAVDDLVARLVTGGPAAMTATKRLLNDLDGSTDATLVRKGAELSAEVLRTPETRESLRRRLDGPPS
jgi:methylglutaconyl-CoA hydratase